MDADARCFVYQAEIFKRPWRHKDDCRTAVGKCWYADCISPCCSRIRTLIPIVHRVRLSIALKPSSGFVGGVITIAIAVGSVDQMFGNLMLQSSIKELSRPSELKVSIVCKSGDRIIICSHPPLVHFTRRILTFRRCV
jgi:hypothetical protein